MAHAARIDEDNIVVEVVALLNEEYGLTDEEDGEQAVLDVLAALGKTGTWRTCHSASAWRGDFPVVGAVFDPDAVTFTNPPSVWTATVAGDLFGPYSLETVGISPTATVWVDQYGHVSTTDPN